MCKIHLCHFVKTHLEWYLKVRTVQIASGKAEFKHFVKNYVTQLLKNIINTLFFAQQQRPLIQKSIFKISSINKSIS